MSLLRIENLAIGYRSRELVRIPALELSRGTFACLLGRNGQGKSTLLRTLAGLHPPLEGEVRLLERPLREHRPRELARRIAVVLTERPEIPGLRVHDLVAMGRHPHTGWRDVLDAEDREVVADSLRLVEGGHLTVRTLDSLSDGERQRALIARALAQQPELMLLDEITAFLDLPSRITMVAMLRRVARECGIGVVLSSHDLELSLQTADRLWLLPGDGQCVHGAPEDVVLSGALGRAFDQDNVAFSPASGRFESPAAEGPLVRVAVDGIAGAWCERMLRRCGFTVSSTSGAIAVTRSGDGRWHAAGLGAAGDLGGLERLLAAPHMPGPASAPQTAAGPRRSWADRYRKSR
ncbi:ABC transporter ATP-binding protein [Luteimonas sp. SJ-92]|uniref:ABC transporter ATP-binding protein n=1 Tax=Luteimonas salinisoli TaxID=2752307 RepID=A0A853J8I6_9GAMM|nr:ABC transporter ATP-binding protein [Luteimonas salinisoli]NZA25451.1 ABC transporter ATP-binding protein [Luteimonas salinisoli]